MRLSTLLASFPTWLAQLGPTDPDITSITANSRHVQPGSLFIAVRGDTFDGHHFIPQAIANGAVAIVAESSFSLSPDRSEASAHPCFLAPDSRAALGHLAAAWHGFPSRALTLIGVTGTDGKTSTASLIYAILLAAGLKVGLISTVNAVIGDETLDTGFHVTTPDALEIQGYLARMVAAGLTHCVLEVTSHGLAQHRVTGCDFDIAVVTNITHEHLDYHKTYENYRAAKGRLFAGLSTSARKPGVGKFGILNRDDHSFAYLRSILTESGLTYSTQGDADARATALQHTPAGLHFQASITNYQLPITTSLVGDYNISNCLAALAATVGALGIAPEAAQRALAEFKGVPGRMERIDLGQPFTAIVDFAHTPNALKTALVTARQLVTPESRGGGGGRVIAAFGSAGLRDIEKRRLMAETSAQYADLTILTAEDPRTESLDSILEMMAWGATSQGGVEGETFFRVPDRMEALRLAVGLARPGDIVLACGKGHEQSMCFGTTEYPWDDRLALRAALAELLGVPGPAALHLPTSPATRV